MPRSKKIKLHGFDNLTNTLSFNICDVNYAATPVPEREYIGYTDHKINSIQKFLARDTRERFRWGMSMSTRRTSSTPR